MATIIQCSQCRSRLKIQNKLSKGKCPRCGKRFTIHPEENISEYHHQTDQRLEETQIFSLCNDDTITGFSVISPERFLDNNTTRVKASKSSHKKQDSRRQVMNSLLKEVRRGFPRETAGMKYRIGVAVVGLVMIMIPLLYMALIYQTGIWFAKFAYSSFNRSFSNYSLRTVGYIALTVYGLAILVLMIKPFLYSLNRPKRKKRLTRESEPDLFEFVDHLCEMIHAPNPEMIYVDMEGNASAGFRSNFLFRRDKFVLTIGLPLVANLNVSQFTGILAHEFGHFTQRWGMYMSSNIRTIYYWLRNSVREPDLVNDFISECLYSGNIFLIAVGVFLWVPEKIIHFILCCLLFVSNLFCSFLLRQMEYDADRFQGRLLGIDQMIDTIQRVLEVNYSLLIARHCLVNGNPTSECNRNFPLYVSEIRKHLPEEIRDQIIIHMDESETAFLGTHPSFTDRIIAQENHNWPGMMNSELPASFLFSDFQYLSERETRRVFKHLIR